MIVNHTVGSGIELKSSWHSASSPNNWTISLDPSIFLSKNLFGGEGWWACVYMLHSGAGACVCMWRSEVNVWGRKKRKGAEGEREGWWNGGRMEGKEGCREEFSPGLVSIGPYLRSQGFICFWTWILHSYSIAIIHNDLYQSALGKHISTQHLEEADSIIVW